MKRNLIIAAIAACLIILAALPAWGESWQMAGGDRTIAENETIAGDYLFNGERLVVDGTIRGDLLVLAGEVVINGKVEGSVLGAASERLQINGAVGRDVRVAAMELTLNGSIGRSLTGWIFRLSTGPRSRVGQGILGNFIELKLAGEVLGPVAVTANTYGQIGGHLGDDLTIRGGQVVWKAPLTIDGRVTDYTGLSANPAKVKGVAIGRGYVARQERGGNFMFIFFLGWLLGSLLISIILYRLFPKSSWALTEPTVLNFRKNLLAGLLSLMVIPLLILLLGSGIIPYLGLVSLPLVILLVLVYLMLLFFSGILVNLWFGRLIFRSRLHPILMIVIGGLILAVLSTLPLLNLLVVMVTNCVGVGMLLRGIRFEFRDQHQVDYRA
ncbi:hypothetical protein EDC14_102356 [Hydrogenispora ethanolica]|uniref:Polymer-forming cytoskeletal protein n=1 Tax=Hydrogenispora ethanolica TaxID=1082276 RepID=A0A4R1RAN6_HYDET|nr:polymer-forming cytoskeletal protein [Hydrogenispora ethanolica]TCL62776.1 hypothetical protein EDC14_102356 [Hydrogenispora ethanolica]